MFDLINIFDVFLPQLLLYPNPTDPLNGDAARLLQKDPEKYNKKIKEFVKKYASENIAMNCSGNKKNGNGKVNGNNNNSSSNTNGVNGNDTPNNKEEKIGRASCRERV